MAEPDPRISKYEMFMQIAEVAAQRSACSRRNVGAVVADPQLTQVLGFGYNGPEAGGPNRCDGIVGECGCLHAEVNALVKARPGPKILFTTVSPCLQCAKLAINAGVIAVYFRNHYRTDEGEVLLRSRLGIIVSRVMIP